MKLLIVGTGALAEQAGRLAQASSAVDGFEIWNGTGAMPAADRVLPATRDESVLKTLEDARSLFDPAAWALTSSRLGADAFLQERGFPVPAYFPGGSEPYIVKPDRGGAGKGIWVTEDFCEVGGAVNAGFVTQEEMSGPVWSVAVTGRAGDYTVHAPARLDFVGRRRAGAVCEAAPSEASLTGLAADVAGAIGMRGILEVEAIWSRNAWWITDLNARLPLYTPDAVLKATGVNLLDEIIRAFAP